MAKKKTARPPKSAGNTSPSKKVVAKKSAKKSAKKTTKKSTTKSTTKSTKPKGSAKKKSSKSTSGSQTSSQPSVTVRMYCQGLGDCFLLSFPRANSDQPYRILIDCGVFQKTPGEGQRLRAVAQNLLDDTGGEIDLLVVTHEHWDHVSGFAHAQTIFSQFRFGQVWLSWAENPQDPAARQIKAELGKKKATVARALAVLDRRGGPTSVSPHSDVRAITQETEQLMDFFGPALPTSDARLNATSAAARAPAAGASSTMTLGSTMDWLRNQVTNRKFREPGECLELPETGVRVYVLGPPKEVSAIRKMDPTGDQGYRHLAATASLPAAIDGMLDSDHSSTLPPGPFDDRYALPEDQARDDIFFREYYGFTEDPLETDALAWRRIDDQWWFTIGQLALQLDRGVNNTSLALAFELPDGRCLIFPGDAQIGSWLSWDKVKFADQQGHPVSVTSADLLKRAVVYKVGHHGSHNATRKAGGLEDMLSGQLVALIPTDEAYAKTKRPPSDGWKMPFDLLYQALGRQTDARILRADFDERQTQEFTHHSSSQASFLKQVTWSNQSIPATSRPLFVEYRLP